MIELLYLPINRYGDHGELIEEPAGYMTSGGMSNEEAESYVHAYCFLDNAYANLQFSGVQYAIDRDSVQSHLCQHCLDSINDLWFTEQPPAEFAIISFENRTIQPLLNMHPWFSAGNYGIDCEFEEDSKIDLLIHYIGSRYEYEKMLRISNLEHFRCCSGRYHPPGGLPSLWKYRYNKRKMPRYGWHHTGACRPKSRNKGRHSYYTLSCRKKKGQKLK